MEEIRIKSAFASNKERINYALKLRKDIMRHEPITHERLTRLDKWLIAQPELPYAAVAQIWTRMMWVTACEYERETDRHKKDLNLLSLCDHYLDFLQFPEELQKVMRPYWLEWHDVLKTEREKLERVNGATQ